MIEIEKIELEAKTVYGDLKPGDVFNFGHKQKAIGIKTLPGHILVESCYGSSSFEQISPLPDGELVIFHGRLVKLGVTNKCNHSD